MTDDRGASPLALARAFVARRWPDRARVVQPGEPRQIAELTAMLPVDPPPAYQHFLRIGGGGLPSYGLFKTCALTVPEMLRHYRDRPHEPCPHEHFIIGVSRDPLGADFLILASRGGELPFELPLHFHYRGTALDPDLLVSQYFEECLALELFEALVLAHCRHRVEWTTLFCPDAFIQFESEDPAEIVSAALTACGLRRLNANIRCAMYTDEQGRHVTYRPVSDTRFFEINAGCHTADELAALRAAIEERLRRELIEEIR